MIIYCHKYFFGLSSLKVEISFFSFTALFFYLLHLLLFLLLLLYHLHLHLLYHPLLHFLCLCPHHPSNNYTGVNFNYLRS